MSDKISDSKMNVHLIAQLLGAMSVLGFLIGFLRDRTFAYFLGASQELDIYILSFRIPDTLFILATSLVSLFAVILLLEEKRGETLHMKEFLNTVFYCLITLLVVVGTALFFFIPYIGEVLFKTLQGEDLSQFILFSRILLVQASLFSISVFFTAILHFNKSFLAYSLITIIYNIGIIIGTILLYPLYGVTGIILGVVLGIASAVVIQLLYLIKYDLVPKLVPKRAVFKDVGRLVMLSIPRAMVSLVYSMHTLFILSILSSISVGLVSIYYFASAVQHAPLTVFGISYATAAFPFLVQYMAQKKYEEVNDILESIIRKIFLFIIPIITIVVVLSEEIIKLLFQVGEFTQESTVITAIILGIFILNVLPASINLVFLRAFYASQRVYMPVILLTAITAIEIGILYICNSVLDSSSGVIQLIMQVFNVELFQHAMLILIMIVIVIASCVVMAVLTLLSKSFFSFNILHLAKSGYRHTTASLMSGVVMYSVVTYAALEGASSTYIFGYTVLAGISGILVWYGILYIYKDAELKWLQRSIVGKIWKK